jgi:hypothetical protein
MSIAPHLSQKSQNNFGKADMAESLYISFKQVGEDMQKGRLAGSVFGVDDVQPRTKRLVNILITMNAHDLESINH